MSSLTIWLDSFEIMRMIVEPGFFAVSRIVETFSSRDTTSAVTTMLSLYQKSTLFSMSSLAPSSVAVMIAEV